MNNTFRIKSAKKNDQKYLFFKTHTKLNNKFILPGLRKEKTEIKLDNDIYFLGSNSKGKDRKNMTQKLKLKSDIFTSVNKEKIIIDDLRKNLDREIEKNKVLKKKLENKDFEIKDLKNKLTNQEKENNKLIDELHEVYVKYDRLKRFVSGESGVYIEVEDKLKEEIENHNKIVEEFAQKLGKQTFENEALTKQVKKFKVLNSNLDGALNATIKENDDWWGKEFTEWNNVRKAKPLFKNHHQPRIPGDNLEYLGYYDLSNEEVIMKQIELAKAHGIYGFGIYHYWFKDGRRVLEKPVENLLKWKDIDMPFCFYWANESWARSWSNLSQKNVWANTSEPDKIENDRPVLLEQSYGEKKDWEEHFNYLLTFFKDKRYIKINDRTIIGLYEPKKIPNLSNTISFWRKEARNLSIGEIYIIACLNNNSFEEMKNIKLFEAVYEFSPRDSMKSFVKDMPYLVYMSTLYKRIDFENTDNDFPLYRGSMLEFDNSPRKKKKSSIFENYSPEQFYMLNKKIIKWTRKRYNENNRFIFINAWNEWGEGTYLEPDKKYGYSSINALSKALFDKQYKEININFSYFNKEPKIAIQVHLYYDDLITQIINTFQTVTQAKQIMTNMNK